MLVSFDIPSGHVLSFLQELVTVHVRLDHMNYREARHVVGCRRMVSVSGMPTDNCEERGRGDETKQPKMSVSSECICP